MVTVRNLEFSWADWDRDAKIMLCFNDPAADKMLEECAPLAWKVFHISKGQFQATNISYSATLAFGSVSFGSGNIVSVSTWTGKGVDLGDTVELKNAREGGGPIFGETVNNPRTAPRIICTNQTGLKRDISVGFMNNGRYEPTFAWKNVGHDSSVAAKFHPVVKFYMTADYKQGQLLDGAIETAKPFAEINLAELAESTSFRIVQEDGSKRIKLVKGH